MIASHSCRSVTMTLKLLNMHVVVSILMDLFVPFLSRSAMLKRDLATGGVSVCLSHAGNDRRIKRLSPTSRDSSF